VAVARTAQKLGAPVERQPDISIKIADKARGFLASTANYELSHEWNN